MRSATSVSHPLDPLTVQEIAAAKEIMVAAGLLAPLTRVAFLGLEEPAKPDVLAFKLGAPVVRRVRALLVDLDTGRSRDVLLAVRERRVVRVRNIDPVVDGQVPLLNEELDGVEEIVNESEEWCAALKRRDLSPDDVRAVPLSAGSFGLPGEMGTRTVRVLAFLQDDPDDLPWAHPIDGLTAYVDLTRRVVTTVIDGPASPVPSEPGNLYDPPHRGPARTTVRPIEITQPEGPGFHVEGSVVTWENWSMRVGFNAREGLTLHQIGLQDEGRTRPVIYRASLAEMVVPYGDPSPQRFWQNYFDGGEYLLGRYTNSLELGCDCLGEIVYLDAVVAGEEGDPRVIRNAICMHEEDFGVLWKHTDIFAASRQVRRQRRLVISFFSTIGNYDYGFYWYFYLDGTIEFEAKLTGVPFTCAHPREGSRFVTEVAPGLGAPVHQHLFCARLDMMVDGLANAVDEVDVERLPAGPGNPHGNAFARRRVRLSSESQARRVADQQAGRVWHILNTEERNRLGQPTTYVLVAQPQPTLLAAEQSSIASRAAFATRHLWVTEYDPAERHPAGDLVNQHPGGGGLPEWTRRDRAIDGADIVVWHTFGLTHFPRPEDWPVMPVDRIGFTLRPSGFFDRNPTLDLPAPASAHCRGKP